MKGLDAEWAGPTYKILRIATIAFGVIIAYPYVPGSDSDAFKGVSVFIGVVFSLGSSTAIANIIAGYMNTYRRAFKMGDRVRIGETTGDVIETRLQVTRLRSLKPGRGPPSGCRRALCTALRRTAAGVRAREGAG